MWGTLFTFIEVHSKNKHPANSAAKKTGRNKNLANKNRCSVWLANKPQASCKIGVSQAVAPSALGTGDVNVSCIIYLQMEELSYLSGVAYELGPKSNALTYKRVSEQHYFCYLCLSISRTQGACGVVFPSRRSPWCSKSLVSEGARDRHDERAAGLGSRICAHSVR